MTKVEKEVIRVFAVYCNKHHLTYAITFFRVSNPPKKTEKQLTMLVIILSLMIASFGTLIKLPKYENHQNPGIFVF